MANWLFFLSLLTWPSNHVKFNQNLFILVSDLIRLQELELN